MPFGGGGRLNDFLESIVVSAFLHHLLKLYVNIIIYKYIKNTKISIKNIKIYKLYKKYFL